MATNFFWIGYQFEEFRSQVAISKKKKNSRPALDGNHNGQTEQRENSHGAKGNLK